MYDCIPVHAKLVDEIAVPDIDAEKHFDGLVDILMLNFDPGCRNLKAVSLVNAHNSWVFCAFYFSLRYKYKR